MNNQTWTRMRKWCHLLGLVICSSFWAVFNPGAAHAYITHPVTTLGQLCDSTYITVVRVEKVSKEKGIIIYEKVKDIKGKYPKDQIRHAFDLKNTPQHKGPGDVPIRPDEKDWQFALQWAEPGKTAIMFTLKYDPYGDFGHTYIDGCWYATMCPRRDWDFWYAIYTDPTLLSRWHCGTPGQLASALDTVLATKEAIVPVMVGGTKDDLRLGKAKIQGLKVSLQIRDYNPKRDLVVGFLDTKIDIDAATVAAYEKLGAEYGGWLMKRHIFQIGPKTSEIDWPAFKLKTFPMAKLPEIAVPFALDLSVSDVTDSGLKELASLQNLGLLDLRRTKVTDAGLKELIPCKNLAILFLYSTKVGDAGMKDLAQLKSLALLDLDSTKVTDAGLKDLKPLKNLTSLSLGLTKVSDAGLKEILGHENLTKLYLWGTQVTDEGLKDLPRLNKLDALELPYTKVSDVGLKELAKLKNLTYLDLQKTQLTDVGLKELAGLKSLQILHLDYTNTTDAGLKEVAGIKTLQTLKLSGTQVTDAGLKELARLNGLQNLDLGFTKVTDLGLKELAGLKSLQSLTLFRTKVTAAGVVLLQESLPKCKISR